MTTLTYAWDRGAGDADGCAGRHDGNRGMAGAHRRASHDRRRASASCAAPEPDPQPKLFGECQATANDTLGSSRPTTT